MALFDRLQRSNRHGARGGTGWRTADVVRRLPSGGACPGRSPRSQPSARHSSYSSVLSRKGQEHYHLQLYLRSRRDRPTTHAPNPKGHIHGGPSLLLLLPAKPRLMSVDVTLRASRVARPSPFSLPLAKSPMRGVTDALPPVLSGPSLIGLRRWRCDAYRCLCRARPPPHRREERSPSAPRAAWAYTCGTRGAG